MGKRYTIVVLVGSANSPHAQKFIQGMYTASKSLDVNINFFLSFQMASYYSFFTGEKADEDYDAQASVVYDYAQLCDNDALIFTYEARQAAMNDEQFREYLKRADIPYIVLDDDDETGRGTSIKMDNYKGMFQIVKHLVEEHKYKKLTYLSGPKDSLDAQKRLRAFEDVLKANNIPLNDKMIAYGDFTKNVEKQIEDLLRDNPDMDCMICANDMMAFMAYKVMKERGIVVGKDIAVTGYDDWVVAEALNPPLTTARQNELDIAYVAVREAIKLCDGGEPCTVTVPTIMKVRGSCGCGNSRMIMHLDYYTMMENKTGFVDQIVKHISDYAITSKVDAKITEYIENELRNIVEGVVAAYINNDFEGINKIYFYKQIENLLGGKYRDYISSIELLDIISWCLAEAINKAENREKVVQLTKVFARITTALQSAIVNSSNNDKQTYQEDNMYIPLVSRDMMAHVDDREDFYKAALKILAFNRVKRVYICTGEKPFRKKKKTGSSLPKKMYLAAYQSGAEIVAFSEKDKTSVGVTEGFLKDDNQDRARAFFIYNLFVGNLQYGAFACEIEPSDSMLMYQASQQISLAMEYRESSLKQERMREKLENFVDEVNEKNKILSFISEYDPMTECLNRRGFIEQVSERMRANEGEKVTVIMADMDGLKYINDNFGHPDGDEAIIAAGMILKEALGPKAVVARLGGDEYCAFISGETRGGREFSNVIANTIIRYNDVAKKPYMVDMSVGYCDFICNSKIDLEIMLKNADVMLYDVKRKKKEKKKQQV